MSPQKGRAGALSEFYRSVYQATSTRFLNEKFHHLCQISDRLGMIKILMDIEQVRKLRIEESYRGKDDNEARRIYDKYRKIGCGNGEREVNLRVIFLTRALFAALPSGSLFKEILLERAGCWYSVGALARCIKDCDYLLIIVMAEPETEQPTELSRSIEEIKVKCTELRVKCMKTSLSRKMPKDKARDESNSRSVRIDGRPNGKLRSCSDSVTMSYDKTRGRHLVSTRNIKTGSVIMIDKPFSFSTDAQALQTNCLHCHVSLNLPDEVKIPCDNCQTVSYCSNECRKNSWLEYHRYECPIFDYFYETSPLPPASDLASEQRSHLLLAWRTTIEAAIDKKTGNCLNESFLRYQESFGNEEENRDITIEPYDPLDYRTVFALETHCRDSSSVLNFTRSLRSIFLAKALALVLSKSIGSSSIIGTRDLSLVAVGILRHMQAVDCNAYEIVENTRDEETRVWQPRNVGGAIYSTVSLVNHACYPNVVRHSYPGGQVVVRALRFIAKGTEILDCYGPHFVSDSGISRRRYLHDKYHFTCTCEACTNDYELPNENSITYKCSFCGDAWVNKSPTRCANCNATIDLKKLQTRLAKSMKKRADAVAKMFQGNYTDALPVLLEHATLVDKILAPPSLEAIKTQQSIVQCYNSLSSVCPSIRISY